jgi:hypothetical protein
MLKSYLLDDAEVMFCVHVRCSSGREVLAVCVSLWLARGCHDGILRAGQVGGMVLRSCSARPGTSCLLTTSRTKQRHSSTELEVQE